MARINGKTLTSEVHSTYDAVVIGSGPGGAACAAVLAESGAKVAIVEEGDWINTENSPTNLASSFKNYYRDNGTSAFIGSPPTPFLQGCAVGGSSTINGAISWRLPEAVYRTWIQADPALEQALPWESLVNSTEAVEQRLNISPTTPETAGPRNLLMAKGANALGLENRPISRNVKNCQSSGHCLHYCRNNAKQSMDKSYLLDAEVHGADIYSNTKVTRIHTKNKQAKSVEGASKSGEKVFLKAKIIVLAASAVQSPLLLLKSGIKSGPVGEYFQCHPGVSVSGRFPQNIHNWRDATQGHEVIGLCHEGIKFESAAMDISVMGMRLPGAGVAFMENLQNTRRHVDWAAAIKSSAKGKISLLLGQPLLRWSPSQSDVLLFRKGAYVLGQMMFAAGAESIYLGAKGWGAPISDAQQLELFGTQGPSKATDYNFAVTHMFGTCRMGSDKSSSVVNVDFQHHEIKGLYISDSSVFPSNTGVNPQTSILAMSRLCAQKILGSR